MSKQSLSRDRSMALNNKWILDQNPSAKIVVWAHNGHVSRGRAMYRSMGEELHDIYGSQMVVFGFSFNRGSFQAVGARGGGLQNFTVGPAPESNYNLRASVPSIFDAILFVENTTAARPNRR